jgi:hypothetical protein
LRKVHLLTLLIVFAVIPVCRVFGCPASKALAEPSYADAKVKSETHEG